MLAFFYLAITLAVGDVLSRRFYRFVNWPHRLATSFLVGLLVSSPFTYLLPGKCPDVEPASLGQPGLLCLCIRSCLLAEFARPSAPRRQVRDPFQMGLDFPRSLLSVRLLADVCNLRFPRRQIPHCIQGLERLWCEYFALAELCAGQQLSNNSPILPGREFVTTSFCGFRPPTCLTSVSILFGV